MLWRIDLPLVHTVSRDANSQVICFEFTKSELWNAANIFARACVSGLTHSHAYEMESQWNEKCSVTAP